MQIVQMPTVSDPEIARLDRTNSMRLTLATLSALQAPTQARGDMPSMCAWINVRRDQPMLAPHWLQAHVTRQGVSIHNGWQWLHFFNAQDAAAWVRETYGFLVQMWHTRAD